MPLGIIRRKLQEIRYYSAPRRLTAWSRAADIVMIASLLAAPAVAWVLDRAVVEPASPRSVSGRLYLEDGGLSARLSSDRPFDADDALPCAVFHLTSSALDHGWPFVTSRRAPRVRLDLTLTTGIMRVDREDAWLEPDSPQMLAIECALRDAGRTHLLAALEGTLPEVSHHARAWLANIVILAVAMPLISLVAVSVARVGWNLLVRRRLGRRLRLKGQGRCPSCGYDLRASLFSERCPECGARN